MENGPNNANAPATKADLNAEFGKFEEQANVILEAVGETMVNVSCRQTRLDNWSRTAKDI